MSDREAVSVGCDMDGASKGVDRLQKSLDRIANLKDPNAIEREIWEATGFAPPVSPALLPCPPLQTVRMSEVEPKPVKWLWNGRIPLGKITTLDGDPGVGKTAIVADLAARVSRGAPMPDGSAGVSGDAIIMTAEDDIADTIRPRLEAAHANLDRVHMITMDEFLPSVVDDVEAIVATVLSLRARLLIVDPFATFVGARTNTQKTAATSAAMIKIKMAADETGCAVVLVRHLNKDAKNGKAIYRGTDSISIIGTARAGLLCGTDPERPDYYVLACTKANLAAKDATKSQGYWIESAEGPCGSTARVRWSGDVDWCADQILGVASSSNASALEDVAEWLRELLSGGPMLSTDVRLAAEKAGYAERTLSRAKHSAGVESRRRSDGRWEFRLVKDAI